MAFRETNRNALLYLWKCRPNLEISLLKVLPNVLNCTLLLVSIDLEPGSGRELRIRT